MNSSARRELLDGVALLDEPGGDRLRLHFRGPFEGGMVDWDAALFTPTAWAAAFAEELPQQNIIDIGEGGPQGITLHICLQVAAIDLATVRKAVVMVRQYKRLRRGRHRYG